MWLTAIGVAAALAFALVVRWARSIPAARAWYPETHDKITCHALDVLHQTDRKTLFGWVLSKLRDKRTEAIEHVEWQLRRGSIDEDMYSHTLNVLTKLGTLASVALGLLPGASIAGRAGMLALKELAKRGLYGIEALEGANGGYHFYNPFSRNSVKGLSEPVWVAVAINALSLGDTSRPMPSAVDRAFQTGGAWKFDNENRNYTYDDASRYFRDGYAHLAFYTMGRVGHLLHDMAVPSHVRDDSHFGIPYVEGSDPLEYYAGGVDWTGDPHAPGSVRWGFDPNRIYSPAGSATFADAFSDYPGARTANRGKAQELFEELARWAHATYYSYGTIPGNADSHDPNDTDVAPLARSGAVDWTKCQPSPEAMRQALERIAFNARKTYELRPGFLLPPKVNHTALLGTLTGALTGAATSSAALLEFVETLRTLIFDIARTEIDLGYTQPERLTVLIDRRTGENFLTPEERAWRTSWFWLQDVYPAIDPPLVDAARALGGSPVEAVMKAWIDAADQQVMFRLFDGFHGPCDLDAGEIQQQYAATVRNSIVSNACLLANWFESMYSPANGPRGVGIWRNRDTQNTGDHPELLAVEPLTNGCGTHVANVATIGVTNHFPVAMDLMFEFELVDDEEDEADEAEEIELELDWGQLGPFLANSPAIAAEGEPPKTFWRHASAGSLRLSKDNPKQSLTLSAEMYNRSALERLALPRQGAIARNAEAERLKPLNLTPGAGGGSDDFDASLLRIVAKTVEPGGDAGRTRGMESGEPVSAPGPAVPV